MTRFFWYYNFTYSDQRKNEKITSMIFLQFDKHRTKYKDNLSTRSVNSCVLSVQVK